MSGLPIDARGGGRGVEPAALPDVRLAAQHLRGTEDDETGQWRFEGTYQLEPDGVAVVQLALAEGVLPPAHDRGPQGTAWSDVSATLDGRAVPVQSDDGCHQVELVLFDAATLRLSYAFERSSGQDVMHLGHATGGWGPVPDASWEVRTRRPRWWAAWSVPGEVDWSMVPHPSGVGT
ncbi:MAG: hypothetical protein ACI8PZ_002904 [Myxococcota bacterium]